MDMFKRYHPIIGFIYFLLVISGTILIIHPVFLFISLVCSISCLCCCKRKWVGLRLLPFVLFTALLNPIFNHRGITILAYFPNGNPLTLESIVYGCIAAVVLVSVICWFGFLNQVMTSDKWMYLFGKIVPALSLLLSMSLRFIPRFMAQIRETLQMQTYVTRRRQERHIAERVRLYANVLSAVTTRAFEESVDTADSMRSRGYGIKKRTSYSVFRISARDILAGAWMIIPGGCILTAMLLGQTAFYYYPSLSVPGFSAKFIFLYITYFLLCSVPIILELGEKIKWNYIRSIM